MAISSGDWASRVPIVTTSPTPAAAARASNGVEVIGAK